MDYGALIRDAWTITWRHRFLWILGLFAATTVGSCSTNWGGSPFQWQMDSREVSQAAPPVARVADDVSAWIAANLGLILLVTAIVALIALVLFVVSFVAQGAMARATTDLARGRPTSLGEAWRAGLHLFWRYLGMWALLFAAALLAAAVIGFVIAIVVAIGALAAPGLPRTLIGVLVVLVGIPLALGAIALSIAVSILFAYAQRAIAVENLGPIRALRSGWDLFRAHLGTSLIAWLVNVALAIGAGIVIAFGVAVVAAVLIAVGAILWASLGFATPTIVYIVLGALALLAIAWGLGGIANTFFWTYWTLVYLRLRAPA